MVMVKRGWPYHAMVMVADHAHVQRWFQPFEPDDFSTCPAKLPHDLAEGQKLARWFGSPYNKWYVGKITEVNRRRSKQENVAVEFVDEEDGTTWAHFVASAEDYGADKLWVVLEPIPIELDDDGQ